MKIVKYIIKSLFIGIFSILIINFLGQFVGLHIPFSFINICLIGVFYLPGLILVLLILLL